ncbi:hypothetical protein EBE87_24230 [Pseudoroseomonas wenyumeiae]|uniref:Uncharacterized protein n=1 Tax=Teichococcus wenyumeiae TaxID=2478470 RepID=A0A3A9JEF4_9PROT|nr:DUF6489 family protein [Pseudoroseomonas wenyumeiae]RKK03761.1 hypothetical protein D6Z83_12890 [Pseudoroseomonas wenyumeiae]RMI17045.1 hypothetical protein EBE87_24230 [Pseudoroseomonas wenyumeiae]
MKFTVEIDCTPEEARHFFGLPEVKPMQDAAMAKLGQQMADAVANLSPEAMLRNWLPLSPWSPAQMQEAMSSMFKAPSGTKKQEKP